MKTIYTLYESILDDMDDVIAKGDDELKKNQIKRWVEANSGRGLNVGYKESYWLRPDYKINVTSFRPFDWNGESNVELPAPDYIKFAKLDDLLIHTNFDLSTLPEIDKLNLVFISNKNVRLALDFTKIPSDNATTLYYDCGEDFSCIDGIAKFPKFTVDQVVYNTSHTTDWQFDGKALITNPKKVFNGLKCTRLLIPDVFFTTSPRLLYSYKPNNSWSDDRTIEAGSPEAEILDGIFANGGFKELYTYCTCTFSEGTDAGHRIKKTRDGYVLSKRKKRFTYSTDEN